MSLAGCVLHAWLVPCPSIVACTARLATHTARGPPVGGLLTRDGGVCWGFAPVQEFGVQGFPTIKLFVDGKVVEDYQVRAQR